MKLNQQTAALALCTLLGVSVLAGCGRSGDFSELQPAVNKIEYTNLNDSGSRELLKELLSDTGVSDRRIQSFFRRVDRFNDSVKQEWLTDGFEEAELLYTKYDPYAMQDEWTAKNGTFPGYNCRITAMILFGDFLSVSADSQINTGEDVLFVDEIHRLNRQVEEVLYPAMEDFAIDIMIGKGASARSIRLDLPKFTLVGATTRAGLLSAPLRDRFGVTQRLEFYDKRELTTIVLRSAQVLGVEIEPNGAAEIAKRSRGTPRLANRLLKRVRDFAQVKYDGVITYDVACFALDLLEVDQYGLDKTDRRILQTLILNFQGGPVGLETLAASIGEDSGTLEDVYEPYLLQTGFLNRTPRGRMASVLAYTHLGYPRPDLSTK